MSCYVVRGGKSSIQKVVFHKLSPNETLFLESTSKVVKDDISNSSFVQFQVRVCFLEYVQGGDGLGRQVFRHYNSVTVDGILKHSCKEIVPGTHSKSESED